MRSHACSKMEREVDLNYNLVVSIFCSSIPYVTPILPEYTIVVSFFFSIILYVTPILPEYTIVVSIFLSIIPI